MSNSQFAVIGLGSFGYAVARTLLEKGCQVLCIDRLEERLEQVREIATLAVQADATDEKVLREVGVRRACWWLWRSRTLGSSNSW
jgi:trk system potassium uptake protein TrkA